ncbi:MAG TPA: RsmE family RNA methyltransferase [Alphaproteobacteria bacterium]|nr:RsmE family RNA methyltransferase [Alphaproteobacteria bacterium]
MSKGDLKRFFIDDELREGAVVKLPATLARRLDTVLRTDEGARIGLFNGSSGLFEADVLRDGKAGVGRELLAHTPCPPLELWLGLPKRDAFETCLRMATELGVTRIVPLLTSFVVKKDINPERAHTLMVEACEQCERLDLPVLAPIAKLDTALHTLQGKLAWAASREVEGREELMPDPMLRAILIGPEGGFSPAEENLLMRHAGVVPVSLGDTILRVDTAVAAGLARLK